MLELQPDLGDVHLARPASAATTRSALEAIKKKFELSAVAAAAGREASSEKFLLEKGRETSSWPVVVPSTGTPDAIEPPVKSNVVGGLVDSRSCAKPAKKKRKKWFRSELDRSPNWFPSLASNSSRDETTGQIWGKCAKKGSLHILGLRSGNRFIHEFRSSSFAVPMPAREWTQ
ncbi:hypothetical protein ZHAS_00019840 [Anopheles sinensis]|uniref:Uncharacterized protein n=1 Tax=Anopheles sinensis TaxID=74873 RepID=A0A084WNF3_ANOSI|nr:hypothetical protein ZHAS_00019840 [Anopheles sinensis]